MKGIVHLTKEEDVKAVPILLRHSPGMVLPPRTYILSEDALKALREAGVRFSELSAEVLQSRPLKEDWHRTVGYLPDDEITKEAARLGREYRKQQTYEKEIAGS